MKLTMAQALIKFLSQQYVVIDGNKTRFVESVFAIFGHGNVTGIGEALEYDNHGIRCLQGRNEQSMAHAAIAFAKQKNRLAIIPCTSSIGPGATNMVTAAATATANRIPLLLLPGDIFASRQPDPVLQQIEQPHDYSITVNDSFKPVSKYWDRINRPEQLMTACLNAFRVLTNPAETGAVTLCLPQDVQAESYEYPDSFFAERVWHIDRQVSCDRQLKLAAELIRKAEHPVIIAGGGVHYSFACETLSKFSITHGIPVAETQAGKSSLPFTHDMNVGAIGVTGSSVANQLARHADVIIAVGTRLQDFTTASKTAFNQAKIIHINVSQLDGLKMDGCPVIGDAKVNLSKLSSLLANHQTKFSYQQTIKAQRQHWHDEIERVTTIPTTNGLRQTNVLACLNEHMEADDVIICAAGSLPGDLHRLFKSKSEKDYHVEYAYSCMGYEVAAGVGVGLTRPKGEVFVIVGDGSFLMMHSEIITAIQEGIKVNIILLDNSGFQCIHQLQQANGSQGFATEFKFRQQEKLDGESIPINFSQIAQGLGVESKRIDSLKQFEQALNENRSKDGCQLLELKVLADSMSQGYDSWWRVGVAEVSKSDSVMAAHRDMCHQISKAREY